MFIVHFFQQIFIKSFACVKYVKPWGQETREKSTGPGEAYVLEDQPSLGGRGKDLRPLAIITWFYATE
jgi:hypothetical protein